MVAATLILLSGALTSIATAWSINLYFAYRGIPQNRASDVFWINFDGSLLGYSCQAYRGLWYSQYRLNWEVAGQVPPTSSSNNVIPTWVKRPERRIDHIAGSSAYGFPLPCMKWDFTSDVNRASNPGALETKYFHSLPCYLSSRSYYTQLPLHPLYPNLLLNTLFYAVLFSTPYLLRQTRRHLRLRRGHCPACNYDLRGQSTTCPECGRAAHPSAHLPEAS